MNTTYNVRENYTEDAAKVFAIVANIVQKSLGPYGANTVIEKNGVHRFTKDGWSILKEIIFRDHFGRSIHQLIFEICSQVVVKVGDGSTSSIIAASRLYENLQAAEIKHIRPKDLMDKLTSTIEKIVEEIRALSTPLDDEHEDVYRVANISTNGNAEIAAMIQDIYKQTNNSSIEFVKSGRPHTEYEVIKGYRANISYLDQMYANNDRGEANITNPAFLFIDNEMDQEHHGNILMLAKDAARQLNRQLVVVSPRYDSYLLEAIRMESNSEYRANGKTNVVYARASVVNNELNNQYYDFALMTGGQVIDYAFIDKFTAAITTELEDGTKKSAITQEAAAMVAGVIGVTEKVTIGSKFSTIQGFGARNENLYQATLKAAQAEVDTLIERHKELNSVNIDLYKAQTRLSKLRCIMGIIYVGGPSPMERDASYDLVEDAVKACESATRHGYNLGGNLIIPIAIKNIRQRELFTTDDSNIFDIISDAFKKVYFCVLENAYKEVEIEKDYEDIFIESIEKGQCFDLVKQEYNDTVINSSEGDIEVLKAALSIVGLILTSNQYLSTSPEVFTTQAY